jgi:hypothetical protein
MNAKQEILKTFWGSMRTAGMLAAPGANAAPIAAVQTA